MSLTASVEAQSRHAELTPAAPSWAIRLGLAIASVALVGGLVAVGLWAIASAAPAPPARHPFGMGLREAAPSASGLGALLLSWQSAFFTALRGAFAAVKDGGGDVATLLGVAFAYGIFHAAGPGHGKAIIAAYIVSSERAALRGLGLSVAAALIQAGVAIGLVSVVFLTLGGTAATLGRTANAVEIAGFGLIVVLGLVLVWRKAGKLAALLGGRGVPAAADPCECGHIDPAETGRTWPQMAAVALGAGIRPCAGAIVVLTLARATGMFSLGVAATLAMALGTALTTTGLALLAIYAKRAALAMAEGRGRGAVLAGAGAELMAAALVVVIGAALVAGFWDGSAT